MKLGVMHVKILLRERPTVSATPEGLPLTEARVRILASVDSDNAYHNAYQISREIKN